MSRSSRTQLTSISANRRFFGAGVVVAIVAGLFGPASAADDVRTVSAAIDTHDILAGVKSKIVRVTVTNGTPTGLALPDEGDIPEFETPVPPDPNNLPTTDNLPIVPELGRVVNFVSIQPPKDLFVIHKGSGFQGPWAFTRTATGKIVFQNGLLLPGQQATFTFPIDVLRPAADVTGIWSVVTSDDLGETQISAPATTPNGLDTKIRVLSVQTLSLLSPPGVVDRSVTTNQNNITVQCLVTNAGSATLNVTPTLIGTPLAAPLTKAATPVASLGTGTFLFTATQFAASAVTAPITCDASAPGADAYASSISIEVQTQADMADTFTITPGDFVPATLYAFNATVSKTGTVAIADLDTTLTFADGAVDVLSVSKDNLAVAGGPTSPTLAFPATLTPAAAVTTALTTKLCFAGTDANDAPLTITCKTGPSVTNSSDLPLINPTLTAPASLIAGQPAAVKDGATLTLGGNVTRFGAPCGSCSLVEANLIQFKGLVELSDKISLGIPANVTLAGGAISGTYVGSYHADATSVKLAMKVIDNANRQVTLNISNAVDVDNVAPTVLDNAPAAPVVREARHIRVGKDSRIVIDLTEAVAGTLSILDFNVEGIVSHAFRSGAAQLTLEMALPLDEDATPGVTYLPPCQRAQLAGTPACTAPEIKNTPVQTRMFDRVNHELKAFQLNALDRVAPSVPVVTAVDGDAGDLDGGFRTFYSNETKTPFVVAGVRNTNRVVIALNRNANRVLDVADEVIVGDNGLAPLGRAVSGCTPTLPVPSALDSCSKAVTTDKDLVFDGRFMIFTYLIDAAGNVGGYASNGFVLDHVAPKIIAALFTPPTTMRVTWSEPVFGRDFAADWQVRGKNPANESQFFQIGDVVKTSPAVRTLTIDDEAFDGTIIVTQVTYFGLEPNDIYADRAGNEPVTSPEETFICVGAC